MRKIVIGCSGSVEIARAIARKKGWKFSVLDVKKFPDGETNLRFREDVKGKDIYLVQSLYNPNDKLIEVFFAAHTARELKVRKITLIAPYLCYMRQDKRFRPYEAVSGRIMARILNDCLGGIITIDPHLHRYKSLKEIFKIKTKTLTADGILAEFVRKNIKNPIILGPDAESYQWVRKVAKMIGCGAIVLKKKRYTAEHVVIKIKEKLNLKDKGVVIMDDIISTGHTMAEVVKDAKKLGARRIYCVCVHALFVENAYKRLRKLGVKVISCNTIPHETNRIDVSGLISEAL